MRKLCVGIALLAVVGFSSCEKEIGPAISLGSGIIDTTYEASPEGATARRILVEEFTGVKCTNCPAGHRTIHDLIAANPNRVSAIGYQIFNFPQADPVAGETRSDNRTQDATDLGASYFGGVAQLPSAAFDRMPVNNVMLLVRPSWVGTANARLQKPAPVNISISNTYDAATREVDAIVRVAYTSDISTRQRLSLAVIENNIVDAQEGVDTVYAEYDHEHVFRDFVTATAGDAFLDAVPVKRAGRVYERRFRFRMADAWKPEHCALIAFVHNVSPFLKRVVAQVHALSAQGHQRGNSGGAAHLSQLIGEYQ